MEILKITDITISSSGFVKGKKIIDKFNDIIPDRKIEDLPIPFCAVATDILNKKERVFSSGALYDAIRASISIPTVFQPFFTDDSYYVDGGLVNQIPVNRVARRDGDILIVVDAGANIPYESNPSSDVSLSGYREKIESMQKKFNMLLLNESKKNKKGIGIFNLSNRSIGIMMRRISDLMLERYPPDILIQISKESFSTYDFYKAGEIIREGERAAEKAISLYNSGKKVQ